MEREVKSRFLKLAAAGALFIGRAVCSAATPDCSLDIAVYGATGQRLAFEITRVTRSAGDDPRDFLQFKPAGLRASGGRLYFPASAIGAELDVTMAGPERARTKVPIVLNACQQRNTVQFGQLDSGADVRFSILTGRIAGCRITGDWWVRAMPMFGEHAHSGAYDGLVQPDGAFRFVVSMRGVPHIVVIGKDRTPIKAIAASVTVGGRNDVGTVDLRGHCPE